MLKIFRRLKLNKEKKLRLIQLKKNPYKRVDSAKMSEIEKMTKALMVKHSL